MSRTIIRPVQLALMRRQARAKAVSLELRVGVDGGLKAAHDWVRCYPRDPVKRAFWRAVIVHLERAGRHEAANATPRPPTRERTPA